ncbi:zinc ribbon domain-containing protein [Halorussus gelatinilyticus]|uniref:Zinc ribbon domain-containing protein n=1 Tax=Halorussus gelatinilyticus TaxID=2937524 RepID=A0A8U0IFC8_9EURY|nr:zinc ribbon domain-containing protein [Halorussus gelatinilyticus]UPV99682.1 zinc ribbon domain-containing protein [Halorussus gelatinilyticus]
MSSPTTPNFCSQCGSALSPGDAFCSKCGTAVDGESSDAGRTDASASGSERAAGLGSETAERFVSEMPSSRGPPVSNPDLRRRVERYAVEGWDVKRDDGDRVVMINRTLGSPWIHAFLLLATSPVGNLLYAWYRYSPGAERVELRADGTERRSGDEASRWTLKSAVGVAAGLTLGFCLALVATLLLWVTSSLVPTVIAGACLLAALASIPLSTQLAPGFESPTTFGRRRTTDERVVDEPTRPCSACARPVGTGVRRTFAEKRYLAGIPVETLHEGENTYCRACANGDPFVREGVGESDENGRESEREFA